MAQQTKPSRGKKTKRTRNRGKVGKKLFAILQDLKEDPIDGVEIDLMDDDIYMWDVTVSGPDKSCYSGGKFHIEIKFNGHFPIHPPHFKMVTPIYHMNVNKKGMICLAKISAWNQKNTIREILEDFVEILTKPSTSDQLVHELVVLYQLNEERYKANAKLCTQMYAMGKDSNGRPFSMDMFNNDPTDNNNGNNNNNNNNNNGENKDDNDDGKENEVKDENGNGNGNGNENQVNANQNSSDNVNNDNNENNENNDNAETSDNNNNNSNGTNINNENENKNGDDS